MKKSKNGYSLVVLVITIVVILIITTTSMSMVVSSKEERGAVNFIYDINTLSNAVKTYYSETGILPALPEVISNESFVEEMLLQLDNDDGPEYYNVNTSLLGKLNLNENRGYIVNKRTLNIYAMTPIEYKNLKYYTVTDKLLGIKENYTGTTNEIVISGNPIAWTNEAKLLLLLPSETDINQYIGDNPTGSILVGKGIYTKEDFESGRGIPYEYGTEYNATENGTYTFYVRNENGEVTIKRVVVSRIDDISPYVSLNDENKIIYGDDETGVAALQFRTKTDYDVENETYHTIETLKADIATYKAEKDILVTAHDSKVAEYEALSDEDKVIEESTYNAFILQNTQAQNELDATYYYLVDPGERFEVRIDDYSGNYAVCNGNDTSEWSIDLDMIANNFNIELSHR